MTLKQLNAKIKKEVSPQVELVKGEGYHYFVFDDGKRFETESVYCPYTNMLSPAKWVEEAKDFLKIIA